MSRFCRITATMLIYLIIVIILCILTIVALCDWFGQDARLMRQIPGPKAWPVIGNFMHVLGSPEMTFSKMRLLRKVHGALNQIYVMNTRYVHASDPEDMEKIMSSPENITKADAYRFMAPWLGDGLLLSSGKKWHQRRKLLTKAFHFNILKKFRVTFEQETEHFVKQVEKETIKEQTDLLALVGPVALRVISDTAMGISLSEDEVAFNKYFNSILIMGECFISRLCQVWLHSDFLFNLSNIAIVQKRILSTLHEFTSKVINNRREIMKDTNSKQVDKNCSSYDRNEKMALLDLLLENEKSGTIDNEGIREEVDTFMFEGFDTTTIAISFFLMAIANEPAIQSKIYEEQQRILGDNPRLPNMEEVNEMKYLECCIKESLRLYPSVPFIGRKLLKETLLSQKFAMLEMKMMLSGLLRRFRVEPVTRPSELVFRSDLVLRTKDPIYARFRSRN